jgi:PAS domain S-box-containing protein
MAAARPDFGLLFHRVPHALMVLDRDLCYVAANAAYLEVTGARLEDLVGTYVFAAFPNDPDDPNSRNVVTLRESFERVLASAKPDLIAAIRYRVARYPGGPLEDRIWSARHTPLLGADGRVEYILQETEDVTHLRDGLEVETPAVGASVLERAFRTQETAATLDRELRRMQQMFTQAPGFMCLTRGREHRFEIVNQPYLQLVGHRNVVGKTVAEALPEIVGQGFIELLDHVFASGEAYVGKAVLVQLQRTPDAPLEDRYLDFVYQPIRDAKDQILGIFVQGQDITVEHRVTAEAERVRRELEAAEADHRFLIESIPVQVWTASPDGKLDFVSRRVAAYFEVPPAEILGNGWLSMIHPDDIANSLARWSRSLDTGAPYEIEFRLRRGDGSYRWHLARAMAQRSPDGTILRWFGTNTDIHDAKLALAELRARSEYEQRLIGIVSHDLRNPLNSIALAGSLLASLPLDELASKTVARLTRSADRATRLIADLLDFGKARIGTTIPINPRPTNLREIVEHVVDELQVDAAAREIRIGHAGDEDGRWDADRIAQVLSNLVGNAMQHGPPNAPITIHSRIDGDHAVVAVSNDGPPIPAADMPHLFEPFSRGRNATHVGGSMGLGLYIAREVVVAHGGTIEVESQLGQGTRFTVRLPRFAEVQ